MSSASVTSFRQWFARRSRRIAPPSVAAGISRVASTTSAAASLSHSSDD